MTTYSTCSTRSAQTTATSATTTITIQAIAERKPSTTLNRTKAATRSTATASTFLPRRRPVVPYDNFVRALARAWSAGSGRAWQRHRAHHPARPVDVEPEPAQAVEQPPGIGRAEHPERFRLLRLRHPVERRQHHRYEVSGGSHGWADLSAGTDPAERHRLAALLVHVREAAASAAEELVEERALVPDRRRLEPLPLGHRALDRERMDAWLATVHELLRAPLEVASERWRKCQCPVTGITPKPV